MTRNALRSLFVLAALVATGACQDAVQPKLADPADPLAGLQAGLHPVLVVTPAGPVTTYAQVRLHPVNTQASVASFQAELAFDAAQLQLLGGDFAPGVQGAWHEVSPGRVRFAGLAPAGLQDAPLATLRFASRAGAASRAFDLDIQELVGADDFRDLMPLVAPGEARVVSSYPAQK